MMVNGKMVASMVREFKHLLTEKFTVIYLIRIKYKTDQDWLDLLMDQNFMVNGLMAKEMAMVSKH